MLPRCRGDECSCSVPTYHPNAGECRPSAGPWCGSSGGREQSFLNQYGCGPSRAEDVRNSWNVSTDPNGGIELGSPPQKPGTKQGCCPAHTKKNSSTKEQSPAFTPKQSLQFNMYFFGDLESYKQKHNQTTEVDEIGASSDNGCMLTDLWSIFV